MATKFSALLTLAFLAMLQPLLALAQQAQQPTDPQQLLWNCPGAWHMWGGGWGWGFWWIFPLFMLFMVILCVAIFFLGHRLGGARRHWGPWSGPTHSWPDPTHSALQILNERFAKGEIQKQEYEDKKSAILSSVQHLVRGGLSHEASPRRRNHLSLPHASRSPTAKPRKVPQVRNGFAAGRYSVRHASTHDQEPSDDRCDGGGYGGSHGSAHDDGALIERALPGNGSAPLAGPWCRQVQILRRLRVCVEMTR